MGRLTEVCVQAKHTDGSVLGKTERHDLQNAVTEKYGFRYNTSYDIIDYDDTSYYTQKYLEEALKKFCAIHRDIIVKAYVNYPDIDEGLIIMAHGDDMERLERIVTYEQPKLIKWGDDVC